MPIQSFISNDSLACATVRDRPRHGFALIEVLVAILVLSIGGTGLITLLGQTARTMQIVDRADRASLGASRELDRLEALSRAELLSRVGRFRDDGWTIDVGQRTTVLFEAAVAESDTSPAIARTIFYRPDTNASR